jgi:hypothetical protein
MSSPSEYEPYGAQADASDLDDDDYSYEDDLYDEDFYDPSATQGEPSGTQPTDKQYPCDKCSEVLTSKSLLK